VVFSSQQNTRNLLVNNLPPPATIQCPGCSPGLWKHDTRPATFGLIVDDFGIKYVGKQHADHLLNAIHTKYQLTSDWTGSLYCGIALRWDYNHGTVDLSMPGYIDRALHRFQHPKPYRAEHAPHAWNEPVYGSTTQLKPVSIESNRTSEQRYYTAGLSIPRHSSPLVPSPPSNQKQPNIPTKKSPAY
jgi:hypothetical protein